VAQKIPPKTLTNKDWLLLALASREDGRLTPVQVQKSMFLVGNQAAKFVGPDFYKFVAYDYGPFDSAIYSDLEDLAREELVVIERSSTRGWPIYVLTTAGAKRAQNLSERLASNLTKFLAEVVDWVTRKSFSDLIRSIYLNFPEYKENSVFKG